MRNDFFGYLFAKSEKLEWLFYKGRHPYPNLVCLTEKKTVGRNIYSNIELLW